MRVLGVEFCPFVELNNITRHVMANKTLKGFIGYMILLFGIIKSK
jgi:hypothetical protein